MLSEVQQTNASDEMKSEEREDVKVQLHVTYSSCVPYPAGTSGGLCQHAFVLLILLQHHVPESSSPSLPGLDSVTSGKKLWGGGRKRCYSKDHHGNNHRKRRIHQEERKTISCSLYEARGPAAQRYPKRSLLHTSRS